MFQSLQCHVIDYEVRDGNYHWWPISFLVSFEWRLEGTKMACQVAIKWSGGRHMPLEYTWDTYLALGNIWGKSKISLLHVLKSLQKSADLRASTLNWAPKYDNLKLHQTIIECSYDVPRHSGWLETLLRHSGRLCWHPNGAHCEPKSLA